MKITTFILCLFLTRILTAQNSQYSENSTCPFQLGESKQITKSVDDFSHPKISKDGTKIIVTKTAYSGVYLIDIKNPYPIVTITTEPKAGLEAGWSKDGKEIFFKKDIQQSNGEISREPFKYNMELKAVSNETSPKLKSTSGNKMDDVAVKFNLKTRMVEATDGVKVWNITNAPGVYFEFVKSPDNSKVLIHKNDGNMYIYDINGKGLIYSLGHGLCQSWSPDGKYLLYFIDYDNGNYIDDSDLYISSSDGSKKWKLTNTPDKIELWPYWSPSGDKIAYYEAKSKSVILTYLTKK